MMVFFPTTILEFASTAARTSSSQTNPTGLDSFFSGFGRGGSSSLYEDNGGATGAGTGAGAGAVSGAYKERSGAEDAVPAPASH